MSEITNITNISLPLAVWLASDDYDFHPGTTRAISATSLIKPIRQILLRERLNESNMETPDVSDFIASKLGHAIHDSIERAWTNNAIRAMRSMGYPEKVLQRIVINPETVEPGQIPVYLEQRQSKMFRGYRISGKFDFVIDGELQDFKSTGTFSYTKGGKDEIYQLQGSIYRWLNPEKITEDYLNIQFIFTDWQRYMAVRDPNYPQQRVLTHRVPLLSVEETEAWLNAKIDALEAAADLPEHQIPYCSDADLWRTEPQWKYYANPEKTARATKNCDSLEDAQAYMASKGGKGVIVEVPGMVKACGYCPAFNICTQKDLYDHA